MIGCVQDMIDSSVTQPVVSVVIPAYGLPDYLNEAVESVCRQTFLDYEIIVVDDGSPEGVVERYKLPQTAQLIVHDHHGGAGAATRNTGLRAARGKYVAFLDQDDIWLPETLERQVEALERNPDIAIAFCHYTVVDENLTPLPVQRPPRRGVRDPLKKLISGCFIRTPSTVLVRRDAVEECGRFDESIVGGSDWDFYLRLARRHKFIAVPESLVLYRTHPRQMHKDEVVMRRAKFMVLEKALDWSRDERWGIRKAVRRSYCRLCRQTAQAQLARGQSEEARKSVLQAIRAWPWTLRNYGLLLKVRLR